MWEEGTLVRFAQSIPTVVGYALRTARVPEMVRRAYPTLSLMIDLTN